MALNTNSLMMSVSIGKTKGGKGHQLWRDGAHGNDAIAAPGFTRRGHGEAVLTAQRLRFFLANNGTS